MSADTVGPPSGDHTRVLPHRFRPRRRRYGVAWTFVFPAPMLSRPGPIPTGSGWSFEVKWDGFRALVATVDGPCAEPKRLEHDRRPARTSRPAGRVEVEVEAARA